MGMTLKELKDEYYSSHDFKHLRDETKSQYNYLLNFASSTNVGNKTFNDMKLSDITTKQAKLAYDEWCDRGLAFANHIISATTMLLNYAIRMEHIKTNPFAIVRRRSTEPRKVVWGREDVKRLLDVAYSDFSTRNIGLIAHMAYEWCQRVGDMRMLTWDRVDFTNRSVHVLQSKRNAEVFLPIEEDLYDMLVVQERDFGLQRYVAPRPEPYQGEYLPYSQYKLPL